MQLDNDSQFVQSMIEDREQDIHNIAQSIEEINGIFVDLAQLVNEQSPMIGTGFFLIFLFYYCYYFFFWMIQLH